MPCPQSGRGYSVNVFRALDHLNQTTACHMQTGGVLQHNKPATCVLERCTAASFMHAGKLQYNTPSSACVLGGETWWVLPHNHCPMTTNEDSLQISKEYRPIQCMWRHLLCCSKRLGILRSSFPRNYTKLLVFWPTCNSLHVVDWNISGVPSVMLFCAKQDYAVKCC